MHSSSNVAAPSTKCHYEMLPEPTASASAGKTYRNSWALAFFILFSTSAALLYMVIPIQTQHKSLSSQCGSSVEEAASNNCTFDPLSDLWLPQECSRAYNEEYVNFKDGAPWRYWADEEGHFEIFNRSSYVDGQHYWSTEEDHLVHCAFMILRFADTLETGVGFGLDGRKTLTEHMSHCTNALLRAALTGGADLDFINTETKSGIGSC